MSDYIDNLERQNNALNQEKDKLFTDQDENAKSLEKEVKIRLQFEQKLNNLHAAYRVLETKNAAMQVELESKLIYPNYYINQYHRKQKDYKSPNDLAPRRDRENKQHNVNKSRIRA